MVEMFRKIGNRSGETIGETLVALLIASLALVMLAGAIATSSGIITRSSNTINEYYDTNESVVMMSGAQNGVVTLNGSATTSGVSQTVNVEYKENSEINSRKPVTAFKVSGAIAPATSSETSQTSSFTSE